MKRAVRCALALLATGLVALAAPYALGPAEKTETAPGVVVVWVDEGERVLLPWLKKAAAAYEKETKNRVYLRMAAPGETSQAMASTVPVLPDVLAVSGAGRVVAYQGYALAVKDPSAAKTTPAPTPALFRRPTAIPLANTPVPLPFPNDLQGAAVPAEMLHIYPGEKNTAPLEALKNGKAQAALLTAGQAAGLGNGYTVYGRGDFFLPLECRALTEDGERFLLFLRSLVVQRLLRDVRLFTFDGSRLYGPEDAILYELENWR